jgi:hypothetical protein
MKGIEVKRLRRKVEEHAAGAGMVVPDYGTPSAPPAAATPPVVQAMAYEQPQPQQMYQPQPGMMQPQPGMMQPGMMVGDPRPPPPDNCCLNWLCCASVVLHTALPASRPCRLHVPLCAPLAVLPPDLT